MIDDRAFGPDVSIWDDIQSTPQKVEMKKAKDKGASFVIIKAAQACYVDLDFVWNWADAKADGLLRASFDFLTWETDPIKQADFYCQVHEKDEPEIGYYADFEWWKTVPSNALSILDAFLNRVDKNTGKVTGIYTAPAFWLQYGSLDPKWAKRPLWIANWGPSKPSVPAPWGKEDWTLWQFSATEDGIAYGCESKAVDMNLFNGNYAKLRTYCGLPPIVPPSNSIYSAQLINIAAEITAVAGKLI
jgi:GH25 family lysozyme M1 (1,4-beta-N-acetylmuramidase)